MLSSSSSSAVFFSGLDASGVPSNKEMKASSLPANAGVPEKLTASSSKSNNLSIFFPNILIFCSEWRYM